MNLCLVSHAAGRGGAERSLIEIVDALGRREVRCHVIVPGRGPLVTEIERRGVPLRIVPYKWWMGYEGRSGWRPIARTAWNFAWSLSVASKIRSWDCDAVLSNSATVSAGAFGAAVARRPHLWHLREFGREHHGLVFDLGRRRALRTIDRLSRLVLTNSSALADAYADGVPRSKLRVVYPWVRAEHGASVNRRPDSGTLEILCAGWLAPAKHQDEAVAALGQIVADGLDANLTLAGGGIDEWRRRLVGQAEQLGVAGRLKVVGEVDDLPARLRAADVVVVPSRFEAFGRVTIEAMLAGTPVVGARSGGTAELIDPGRTGWLYEPGDVAALAARLRELARDRSAAQRVAEQARAWAGQEFHEARFADEMVECLLEATGQPGARGRSSGAGGQRAERG